jgi:hypothetical protein
LGLFTVGDLGRNYSDANSGNIDLWALQYFLGEIGDDCPLRFHHGDQKCAP